MSRSLIRSVGPGMALIALGLLAIGLMKLSPGALLAHKPSSAAKTPAANKPQVVETFGKLPLYFIENQGQLDPRVAYYIQGGDKSIYFTGRGVTFALTDAPTDAGEGKPSSEALVHPASYRGIGGAKEDGPQREAERWVVKLDFVNANPNVRPVGQEPTAAVISYFKGPREEWSTGLPTYASLIYRDLWPGIDLVYTGTGSRLKYTFVVQPGADPNQIQLAYRGASGVRINEAGQLEVSTPLEDFQEDKPYAYQEVEGQRLEVEAAYRLEVEASDGVQFGFRVGSYDPHKELVLDPVVLLYAGYIGGSGSESGTGIAVDSTGSAYVTGFTSSSEATFPVTVGPDLTFNGGDYDAFVAKVNPSGTALVYAGYIGSSGNDRGEGIAVDSSGNAYVTGSTLSSAASFPVTVGPDLTYNGGDIDAFVAKVNPLGTALDYAGYIGGSDFDRGIGIAVDSMGNAYVTGFTSSSEATFPVTVGPDLTFNGGFDDAFVAKVNPSGTALDYAGYIGGSGNDGSVGIAVDSTGNAYVTGWTLSSEASFPVTVGPDLTYNGAIDAFVAKVNPSGTALDYAGYIGGSDGDKGIGIAVDSTGAAYVTGETSSTEATFPVTVGPDLTFNGFIDVFVAKVNPSGTALDYAGYIGGSGSEGRFGGDIAVDSTASAYVTGFTTSTEATFPVTVGPDLTWNGVSDAFVVKVNPSGTALDYAGYIGGSGSDRGTGIAVDSTGHAYVTGFTNSTEASFPVTVGPDLTHEGVQDAFVAKIGDRPLGPPTLLANSVVNGASFRTATEPNSAIAPGASVAIFGTDLASDTVLAQEVPLPTTLGDTSVTFNDVPAPLFFVSGAQINAQVPFELMTGTGSVTVQVTRGSETSEAQPVGFAAVSPGIFTLNEQGTGQGAILIANTPFLAAPTGVLEDSRPAQRGEFVSLFCTGLGPVQPEVKSGEVAPSTPPLAETLSPTLVNISDIPALVTFSGLAPGFVGLYQVNVQVPMGVPSGVQEVEIIINGVPGNTVTIAVQ